MTPSRPSEVQVYFLFDRATEWPPVPSEGLRARQRPDGDYELLETPFFVRNIALGDVVSATDDGGVLWAGERTSWGGHQTLRVNPRQDSTSPISTDQVLTEFAELGVTGEELEEYDLVALDIPPHVDPGPVRDLVIAGQTAGRWWYEEACVGAGWPLGRAG